MKTGSYFEMGRTHIVCEDYAMHTDDAVIISDGCSNGGGPSIDTDWGSRFISHLGLQYLPILRGNGDNEPAFIQRVLTHAVATCNALNKNTACLTASLVMAYEKGHFIKTLRVGDGVVGAKFRDGTIRFSVIDFNKNAPFYPIYAESPQSLEDFFSKFGSKIKQVTYHVKEDTDEGWDSLTKSEIEWDYAADPYFTENFKKEDVSFVFVGSDGLEQFVTHVKNGTSKYTEAVPLEKVVRGMIDFGNFNRNFVYHQCHWMMRLDKPGTFVRLGWEPTDDISLGAIYCEN